MNRRLILRGCVNFFGPVLIAHIAASYMAQLCFGAYAWHRGWFHIGNWVRGIVSTPGGRHGPRDSRVRTFAVIGPTDASSAPCCG